MRVVSYAGEHFHTTDDVAEALLQYSKALAVSETSDVVRIPVIADSGATWAEVIIGPASQITTLEVDEEESDLDDADTLRELRERTLGLGRSAPVGVDPSPTPDSYLGDVDLPLD